ncbi:MAG: HD domain-containing protein [Clostridia bacterium]|nr:HD domain-containing protein [Clostridia bacterium]
MIKIPYYAEKIISILEKNGFEAYIVGGCVRDSLLDMSPSDYDITTSATPEEMKAVLSDYKIIETGISHGTLTVLSQGNPLEITTFRCDGEYTDHRRPDSVTMTRNLREDLARRDFTVNAMAYSEKNGLIDLYNGKNDLDNRVIRCVGDASRRFEEDALRIMRALRFAATLGFSIEAETSHQIYEKAHLLSYVSAERIATEFCRLICGKNAADIFLSYREVFALIIPELEKTFDLDQNNHHHIYDVFTHTVKVVEATPPILPVRLAALFHDIAKPLVMTYDENGIGHFYGHPDLSAEIAETVMKRLKLPTALIREVCDLVKLHDVRPAPNKKSIRKYLSKNPNVNTDHIMAIRRADLSAQNPEYHHQFDMLLETENIIREIKEEGLCISLRQLEVNGNDIASLGAKGQLIGVILNKLLADVCEEKLQNEKNALMRRAKQLFSSLK